MNKPNIPIIILNWKGLKDTKECISSLLDQSFKDFKIFLVDNGSGEQEVEQLKKLYSQNPKIELILNKENLGFTRGNNRIIEKIIDKHEYLVLLNNDTAVDKYWLKNLVNCVQETTADIVTSKMVNYQNRHAMDNAGHIMLNTGEVLPLGTRQQVVKYQGRLSNFGACAGACLYSTQMLKRIGLFDEYFVTGYEDAELGVRAVLAGYKSIFEPGAIVYHKGSVSINKLRDLNYAVKLQTNIYYTYLKLMPISLIIFSSPLILLKTLTILFIGMTTVRKSLYLSQLLALKETIRSRKLILDARKNFQPYRILNPLKIIKLQSFFIPYYYQYFIKFIILKKKTVFES